MASSMSTKMIIQGIEDLKFVQKFSICHVQEISFELTEEAATTAFIEALRSTTPWFRAVTSVSIDAFLNWRASYARDFMVLIVSMPNLKSILWLSSSSSDKVPITHLTIILEDCRGLECLVLQGLHFLTSQIMDRPNQDGTFSMFSRTINYLCDALKGHPSLRDFQCLHCHMSEVPSPNANPLMEPQDSTRRPLTEWWVDEMLINLAYIESLECLYIIASPYEASPGRVLLGLCQDGALANQAIDRIKDILTTPQPKTYQKLRLWMASTYKTRDDPKLLLDMCEAFKRNSSIEDFRVRVADDDTANRFVTPTVIKAYQKLLGSLGNPNNFKLTACDLRQRQGSLIDFYCKMNRIGRGDVWRALPTMTRQDWVEEILIQYQEDLDVLFYWNRVYPLFISSLGTV